MTRDSLRRVSFLATGIAGIAFWACAHEPALKRAETQRAAGRTDSTVANFAGVQVAVASDAWKQRGDSADRFAEVQVTLENHSGRALRIRHQDFSLQSGTGGPYSALGLATEARPRNVLRHDTMMRFAAYQPMTVYVPMIGCRPAQDKLVEAHYLAYSYPGETPFGGPFAYVDNSFACPKTTLTAEMSGKSLREGMVLDGARTSGFLYFERPDRRESGVQLKFNLIDANNGQVFGHVIVPVETGQ